MLKPQIILATNSNFPDEVAGILSFTPNFDEGALEAADSLVILEDEEPT